MKTTTTVTTTRLELLGTGMKAMEGCDECGEAGRLWALIGDEGTAINLCGLCDECASDDDTNAFHSGRILREYQEELAD